MYVHLSVHISLHLFSLLPSLLSLYSAVQRFDGVSNGLSMNESESEEGGLEAQPTLARRLFQTPNELGLMSVGSPSEEKGRNVSLHNVR